MLVLGAVMIVVGVISDGVWALAAAQLRQVLTRTPRRSRAVIGTGGVLMIGLGGWLAMSRA
jgi:threonine/homoserine/homoserine lactone efflux protein